MNLSGFSIKRPVTVIMLTLALIVFSFVTLPRLAIDLMPDLKFPVAVVVTSYNGASPSEVEKLVTKPIESAVGTVSDIDSISSVSMQGASQVIIKFNWGTNLDQASLNLREKVDQIKGTLPDDAGSPKVMRFDPNSQPIMYYSLTGKAEVNKLKDLADNLIQSRLERIDGVAAVGVEGGRDRVVNVTIDPAKLAAYGLTIEQVQQAISSNNLSASAGAVREGDEKMNIRVEGEFSDVSKIGLTPIPVGKASIRLQDVAKVEDTLKEVSAKNYLNGEEGVFLTVTKASGGNTIEVADAVKEEVKNIQEQLPANVKLTEAIDTSIYIKDSIYTTAEHALLGGLFGILMLFFFLGSFSSMIIASIVLPVSVLATFVLMYMTGQTINLISLSGLTLGLGSLVDFSVVILENIFRQREQGKSMLQAAFDGSKEVGTAVMASAFAQICVFAPIALTQGIASELFGPLALTVVYSHIAALIFSIMLVPMLSSRMLKKVPDHHENVGYRGKNPVVWFNIGFKKLENGYRRLLKWSLGHRKSVLVITLAMIVGSFALTPMIGAEFFPASDQGQLQVSIKMPNGTVVQETDKVTKQVESVVSKIPELKYMVTIVGSNVNQMASTAASNKASMFVLLTDVQNRTRSSDQIAQDLRTKLADIAGAEITVGATSGFSTGSPVEVTLSGDDLDVLKEIGSIMKEEVKSVKGTTNVINSLEDTKQEYEVSVDPEKASLNGLTTGQIISAVRTAFNGQTVTKYRTGDDEIDIDIKLPEIYREDVNYLNNLRISGQGGAQIALSSVATIKKVDVPIAINREDQSRQVKITADLNGRDLNAVMKEIKTKLDQLNLPDGYLLKYGGQSKDMVESFTSLGVAILLAIILVYMVMASQFESFFSPFIIMFALPPTLPGVLIGLAVTGTTLSVSVLIGYILLVGLVMNNSIVLIDYVNQLRKKGHDAKEAILMAGPIRLRPILMTTLTTILSIGPLAFATGSGTEFQKPMGVTVIFGLSLSTLVTLILVPIVYSWFNDLGIKRRAKKEKRREKKMLKKQQKNMPTLES
ncbi:efflux RND transporter permease subunit [Brevibacillus ginsengisoli]|uniref:efflux RND transporter permease subunit n=1 Tax=Brevibacillus ginsengisoli TaxID=363854 RepID=UPI003CEEA4C0